MKKILFLILAGPFFLGSCSKGFITQTPQSTVTIDALYKTDKDYLDAVIGCYNGLQIQYQNFWIFGDLRSDDSRQEVAGNNANVIVDNFSMASDATLLNSTWLNYYTTIYRCNLILNKIVTADTTVTHKSRDIGEAEFIRALCYFDLVRIFGDLPELTASITVDQAYKTGRTPAAKIYTDIIIKDLVDAQNRLPVKYTGADIGRVTQGAAKALLGKAYLYEKDFTDAEAKLQEVTTLGYALLPSFNSLFDYTRDEHHSEYIFDIEYEQGINLGSNFTNTFCPNSAAMGKFYGITGVLGEANSPTDDLRAAFDPSDLRKDVSVGVKGGFIDGTGTFVPLLATTAQDYTKKYMTSVPAFNDSRANWKVIRYADVLLMFAEALNENGKTSTAITYLNQVHTRAGLPAYGTLTQDDARQKIWTERRLELCFEGQRWFDLVRTGRALTTMQSTGMLPYMTLFPLPLIQVQQVNNPTVFPQNPGYF